MIFKNTHEILMDENIHEVMQSFRAFLLGVRYSVECVSKYIEAD